MTEKPQKGSGGGKRKVSLKAAVEEGYRLLSDGRNEVAVAVFERILKSRPETAIAHNYLGMARANQGRFDEALAYYRKAVEIDPGLADAHNNLGNLLRHLGDYPGALASYHRVLELVPGETAIQINLGKTLTAMGRGEEAAACFNKVLDEDDNNAAALRGLARLRENEGDIAAAIEIYRQALRAAPDSVDILNDLGILLHQQENLEEARDCFRKALEIKPDHAGSLINLSNILRDEEELEEAHTAARRALEIKPDSAAAQNSLGLVLRELLREKESLACFERAMELNPKNVQACNNMGNVLSSLGRREDALAAFQQAIDIDPEFMETYLNRAKVYTFHDGDPELDRLMGYLEREDLSEHYRNQLMFILGKAHDDAGHYAEAFSFYKQGNEMMGRKEPYKKEKHRAGVEILKHMFHRPGPVAKEEPVASDRIPIFIVGMSRSGKTLTESLLARHKDVYDAGERKEWNKAIRAVCERYSISDPYPKCMDHLNSDQIREIGREYLDLVGQIDADSKYIINTLPGNYAHVGLIFLAFRHVRVIYCHRYPLDNFIQVYFYHYKHGNEYSYNFDDLISFYADYQNIMRHWFSLYGERMLNVEYEATIRDPAETARRVYNYCGLELVPESISDLEFRDEEVGHWKNYEPYLGEVREALAKILQDRKLA